MPQRKNIVLIYELSPFMKKYLSIFMYELKVWLIVWNMVTLKNDIFFGMNWAYRWKFRALTHSIRWEYVSITVLFHKLVYLIILPRKLITVYDWGVRVRYVENKLYVHGHCTGIKACRNISALSFVYLSSHTYWCNMLIVRLNSSPPPRQTDDDGRHFADDIFICIFLNDKFCILIKISLKFAP